MKRRWVTYLLAGGFAGLLIVLADLQCRWMTQINEADNEKAHKRLKEQADMFATDFNREIQGAYFNFQIEPDRWRTHDWSAFNERYDFWQERTAYPGLISNFYFFEAKTDAPTLIYDRDQRAFVPAENTPETAELRGRLADQQSCKPVYDDLFMLVLPVHEPGRKMEQVMMKRVTDGIPPPMAMPSPIGYLAIKLDRATITDQIVPALTAKHFVDGDPANSLNVIGYSMAQTMVQVLKQAGDNLTRANVMKEAANLKNLELDGLLPGVKINTSATDFAPISQLQMMRFKGEKWDLFGDVISGDVTN